MSTTEELIAGLTTATTALTEEVQTKKLVLEEKVAEATEQAELATEKAAAAAASEAAAQGHKNAALAIYGTTSDLNAAQQIMLGLANTARTQAARAERAAASAENVAQTNLDASAWEGIHASPNAIVGVFIEDAANDADGGAWMDRCHGLSWMEEALNGPYLGIQYSELNAWMAHATDVELGADVASLAPQWGTAWSIDGDTATLDPDTSTTNDDVLRLGSGLVTGSLYYAEIAVHRHVAGAATVRHASTGTVLADAPPVNRDGTRGFYFFASAPNLYLRQTVNGAGMSVSCTIRPVTAIHGFSAPGSYFNLAGDGRHYKLNANRVTYSDAIESLGMAGTGGTPTATVTAVEAPAERGGGFLRKVVPASGATSEYVVLATPVLGLPHAISFLAQAAEYGQWQLRDGTGSLLATFDLTAGTYTLNSATTASITDLGSGLYLCECTCTPTSSSAQIRAYVGILEHPAANGTDGVLIGAVDCRIGTESGYEYKAGTDAGYTATNTGNRADKPRQIAWVYEAGYLAGYDLTRPGCPMWRAFRSASGSTALGTSSLDGIIVGVTAKDGFMIVWTSSVGAVVFDWQRDKWIPCRNTAHIAETGLDQRIAARNSQTEFGTPSEFYTSATASIVQCDIHTHRDAPVDPVIGRPAPYLLFTFAGSQGALLVRDGREITLTTASSLISGRFVKRGDLAFGSAATTLHVIPLPAAAAAITTHPEVRQYAQSSGSLRLPAGNSKVPLSAGDVVAVRTASSNVLALLRENPSTPSAGLVAWVASTYNTGWMCGDIKRVYLSGIEAGTVSDVDVAVNGSFDVDDWTKSPANSPTFAAGQYTITDTDGGDSYIARQQPLVAGKTYRVTISVSAISGVGSAGFRMRWGNAAGTTWGGDHKLISSGDIAALPGTWSFYFTPGLSNPWITLLTSTLGGSITVTSISFQEVEPDRSYNGAVAQVYGTLAKTPVALGAQLMFFSGFSGTNYIQEAYSSALDFASGFSVSTVLEVPSDIATTHAANFPHSGDQAVNGGFDTDSDWTKGTGWTICGGKATHAAGSSSTLVQGAATVGRTYRVTFTVSDWSAGGVSAYAGSGTGTQVGADGTYTQYVRASTTNGIGVSCSASFAGSVDDVQWEEVEPVWIGDRSAASGPYWRWGMDILGGFVAEAYDGTTTRRVYTTQSYATGQIIELRINLTTDGTLSLMVNGVQVAATYGDPLGTLANASAVLTIGNRRELDAAFPGKLALPKISATVPAPHVARWLWEQDRMMFQPGARACLPDSGAIVDWDYDQSTGCLTVETASNVAVFRGLQRVESEAVNMGSFTKVSTRSGMRITARSSGTGTQPGVELTRPSLALREELARVDAERSSSAQAPRDLDYVGGFTADVTSGSSQLSGVSPSLVRGSSAIYPATADIAGAIVTGTGIPANTRLTLVESATAARISANGTATNAGVPIAFKTIPLPVGLEAAAVFVDGAKRTEGATKYWQRLYDGFQESVQFTIEPGATAAINIVARRMP